MLNNITTAIEKLPALPAGRRAALDALRSHGLPTTSEEDWKYTDLSKLDTLAIEDVAPSIENHDFPAAYDCGLDALNTALAGGRQTRTIEGRVELDTGKHQRLRLQVNRDAQLILDDRTASRFATFFAAIDIAPNARLRLLRIQNAAADAQRLTRLKVALRRDARLEAITVDLGGAFLRHDLDITFDEPGAEAQLHGLYLARGATHVDNHTRIDHRAAHCLSRETYRGIAVDKARAVFNGKIVVHPGAQKTDSEQRVGNLILSKGAEVNAKPELEIYADDVKCAHGATFGQLDEDAVFYLRSRGLDADAARRLLISAFAHEILDRIDDEAIRDRVTREFEAQLK
ncbi:MAG TPA: Fe-S cluster assembly protein SufD [Nevskiaceae bacterium]|nr:Fe-S cluster assembly protein SufD [Nevskiaceae bacterium]